MPEPLDGRVGLAAAHPPGSNPDARLRVLLVEDDDADAEAVAAALGAQLRGVDVRRVPTLGEAIGLLEHDEFDCVVLDLNLPDSTGVETVGTVRLRHPAIPIVVLTGLPDDPTAALSIHAGADDYLDKGAMADDPIPLGRAVRNAVERGRARELRVVVEDAIQRRRQSRETPGASLHVLLVEDDDVHAEWVRHALLAITESEGEQLEFRRLGDAASMDEPAHRDWADCVLLDLTLPDTTGVATLAQALVAMEHVPIIVLTADRDREIAMTALDLGAEDVLVKGEYTPFALHRTVRYAFQRRARGRRLAEMALRDPLTGVANRRVLLERLQHSLNWLARHEGDVGVVYIDLDGFKALNDEMGHSIGDLVLRSVAARLSGLARRTDTVARLGGDEFVVLCPDVGGEEGIGRITARLASAMGQPLMVEGEPIHIGFTAGVAVAREPGDAMDLIDRADRAMYIRKRRKQREGQGS